MNTVSNLLVFTCNHTSCCCSQHCSAQACQQPYFKSDNFSQTVFFPPQVQAQTGRRGLPMKTWPAWPPSRSTIHPRRASGSQPLGHASGDAVQRRSSSPGSGEPILEAVIFGHAALCCLALPWSRQRFRGKPGAAKGFWSSLGCPCFSFKWCLLFLHPSHKKFIPSVMNLVHSYNTPTAYHGAQHWRTEKILNAELWFCSKNCSLSCRGTNLNGSLWLEHQSAPFYSVNLMSIKETLTSKFAQIW